MRRVSQHILLWIVALSILNTSIDVVEVAVSPLPGHTQEELAYEEAYNEIESIVEYVIQEASDDGQQLPDQSGNDQQSSLKKAVTVDFSLPVKKIKILSPLIDTSASQCWILHNSTRLPAGFTCLLLQPPDITC